jgi:hypothetical protein
MSSREVWYMCNDVSEDHVAAIFRVKYLPIYRVRKSYLLGYITPCIIIIIIYLFTAIGFAPGGSSPTLVQTRMIKQHYTVVQHNTKKHKQHNTIKRKHTIIRTQYNKHTILQSSASMNLWDWGCLD